MRTRGMIEGKYLALMQGYKIRHNTASYVMQLQKNFT